jgi:hypothetical protein
MTEGGTVGAQLSKLKAGEKISIKAAIREPGRQDSCPFKAGFCGCAIRRKMRRRES